MVKRYFVCLCASVFVSVPFAPCLWPPLQKLQCCVTSGWDGSVRADEGGGGLRCLLRRACVSLCVDVCVCVCVSLSDYMWSCVKVSKRRWEEHTERVIVNQSGADLSRRLTCDPPIRVQPRVQKKRRDSQNGEHFSSLSLLCRIEYRIDELYWSQMEKLHCCSTKNNTEIIYTRVIARKKQVH